MGIKSCEKRRESAGKKKTDINKQDILKLRIEGLTVRDIAKRFNVSHTTILNHINS
uniref:Helix-turn-helix domain-containing protein n=1 Tax=candidate division CPR3 bacterium TaxID=2268181 RepID=A0A7C4M243_UNCC3